MMDNKFAVKSKGTVNLNDEKQPKSSLNMAVSSVEYNHKIDGKSNAVNMSAGSDGESGGVTGSGSVSGSRGGHETSQGSPTHDSRSAKRKTSDSLYLDVTTPVAPSSQVIHVNAQKPKKGSFQITGVMIRKQLEMDAVDHAEDADSVGDEFDETNTEDLSSEIMDTSKMTDIEQDPSSEDTVQSLVVEDLREVKAPHTLPQTKDESSSETKLNLSETPRASPDSKEENTDPNFGENRFRIVKVSNERFLRGRWTCVDYQDSERTQREKSNEDLGSGNSSAASSVHYVPGVDDPSKNPLSNIQGDTGPGSSEAQPGQSTQTQITNGDYSAQSLTSNIQVAVSTEQTGAHEKSSSIVQSASSVSKPISSQHSQQQNPTASYTTPSTSEASGSNSTSQLPKQDYSASSHQDYLKQGQTNTLPSTQSIPQQASQPQVPPAASGQEFQSGVPKSTTQADSSLGDISNTSLQPGSSSTNVTDFGSGSAAVTGSGAQSNKPSPSDSNIQGSDFHGPPDGIYISPADDQLSTVSAEDDRGLDINVMKPFSNFQMQVGLAQPLLEMVQTMQHPLAGQRDPEDESGASTVAIDNKIEQAMDLVKSHLMFAVREEVLVLKEQIKELLEKNSQLEYENNVLRKGATQETLAKLTQSNQGPSQSSSS